MNQNRTALCSIILIIYMSILQCLHCEQLKTVSEFTFSSPQDIENFRVIKDKATIVEKEFDTSSMQKGMKGTIKITVKQNENSENPFSIQSFVKPDEEIKIIKGNTYEMAFYARASSPVAFLVQVMTDDSPWEMPAKNARYNCSLLQDWKKISYTFTADKTIEKARIPCFILGQVPAGTSIWFSSIKLDTIKIEKKDIPKKIEAKLSLFDMSDSIINPLTPSILRWVIKNTNNIPGIENGTLLSYEINDYNGNNITKGSVKITNTSYFEIPVKLPQGYFEIAFSGYEYPFGICSYPLRENSDPFFSIATHLLMKKYDGKKEAAIKFLNKSGLRRIRDQYVFKFINPDENKYDFDTDYQFEKLHTWYNENNIETFFVFHTMKPQWIETQPGDQYPLNFIQCQNSWSGIIKHWNTNWCAIEVWNEPDLKKAPLDGYVALVKAFRYALEKSKTPGNKVPIIGGIFSTPFVEKKFLEICERNHLLDYIDIFSYHTYFYAETIEESVDYYRSWLKKNNKTSMPIWITESGRSWPVGRIRPTMSQGQVSALDITMKAVESKACGIAGYYPFLFLSFPEIFQDFGMVGQDCTPLRSFSAYIYLARVLSGKKYIGDLKIKDQRLKRARIFDWNDDTVVAILYTGQSSADSLIEIPGQYKIVKAAGIDGRALTSDSNKVYIGDGMVYIWLQKKSIQDVIDTNTRAFRLFAQSQQTPVAKYSPEVPEVVLNAYMTNTSLSVNGYHISKKNLKNFPIEVRINNFSSAKKDLKISIEYPDNFISDNKSLNAIVASNSIKNVQWNITWLGKGNILEKKPFSFNLESNGQIIDTLSIDIYATGLDLEDYTKYAKNTFKIPLDVLPISEETNLNFGTLKMDLNNNIWGMSLEFKPQVKTKWYFPNIVQSAKGKIPFASFDLLAIRSKLKYPNTQVFFLVKEDISKKYDPKNFGIPADNEWHVGIVDLKHLHGAEGMQIDWGKATNILCIGGLSSTLNPSSPVEKAYVEISDIYLIKLPE